MPMITAMVAMSRGSLPAMSVTTVPSVGPFVPCALVNPAKVAGR